MQTRRWEDFAEFDADGQMINREGKLNFDAVNKATVSMSLSEISATPTPIPGNLNGTEDGDLIAVTLVAGQTYTFDFRGAPGGLTDPYLFLLSPDLSVALAQDDDGGAGTSSQITYKPTVSGTYYLYATSFTAADGGSPGDDFGDYTINMWSPEADVPGSSDVVASLATAVTIGAGTTFGNIEVVGDNDYYAVQVKAGQVYTFNYSGGVSGAADYNGEPGENVARLTLYNASGVSLGTNFSYESGLSYFATADTTIYVRAQGLDGAGGYTLDVGTVDPATRDPLESLNWDSADNIDTVLVNGVPTAYVFFGAAGENFGEKAPDGSPLVTSGWQPHQIAAVMNALGEYTPITGINYVITTDVAQAEFRMITVPTATYGARFYPQDPAYGTQQGIGTFNLASGGFGAFPQSLERGGYSYAVILHEFGHAHGIAHPHDTGGGSEVMLGVTGAQGSLGVYNLNQGAYTVMSYNDAWQLHPDGPSAFTIAGIDNGWSATLGAFDIAVLQARYGVHAHNTGDNVYSLTDVADDANYQTIWDSGGNDTIAYGGTFNAQIDLTAATLDYTPTGGGVISFLSNPQPLVANSLRVRGGFTIANGVVVENATGGSGNDVLLGNSANNVLTGNVGNDNLIGRDGNDTLDGGTGNDTMLGGIGNDTAIVGEVGDVVTELAGEGTDTVRASIDYTLGANLENLVLTGTAVNGTGNGLSNVITGNVLGNRLVGGDGVDYFTGGAGNDIFVAEINASKVNSKNGAVSLDVILDFSAGDKIDLSGIDANARLAGIQDFNWRGSSANKNATDLSFKVFDSINGAENALGIDIDGVAGPSSYTGPVTMVLGNVDGGAFDFAIALIGVGTVTQSDFMF